MKLTDAIKAKLADLGKKHNIKLSAEEVTDVKMAAEAKLKDGTSVYTPADSWAEGVECYTMDADGNPQPAADGEYQTDDGKTLTVAGGKITAITEAAPAEEEMTAEKLSEMIAAFDGKLTALTEELNAVKTKLSDSETKLSAVQAAEKTASDKVKTLTAEVEKLSKLPGAKSVKLGKEGAAPSTPAPTGKKGFTERIKEIEAAIASRNN